MLKAAIGAVSVLRTRGPSRIRLKPACVEAVISSSVNPPSGPIKSITGLPGRSSDSIVSRPSGSSSSFVASIDACCEKASVIVHGRSMSGILARPHCSQALIDIFCQCSIFLPARFWSIRATLRWQLTGTIR